MSAAKAPELRDGDEVEDADPQKEGDANRHAACAELPEEDEVCSEKRGHARDEDDAPDARREPAVRVRHEHEQD
jgi:hypothetical protein